jgi:hypothetical protein
MYNGRSYYREQSLPDNQHQQQRDSYVMLKYMCTLWVSIPLIQLKHCVYYSTYSSLNCNGFAPIVNITINIQFLYNV